jgi:hypothetical protein
MNLRYDRPGKSCGVGRGANRQVHLLVRALRGREVDRDLAFVIEAVPLDRLDDSRDRIRCFRIEPKMLSHGVAVRPKAQGELLVDDGCLLRVGDGVHIGLRLGGGYAGLEARYQVVVLVATALRGIGSQGKRHEDVDFIHRIFGGQDFGIEAKFRTKNANDGGLLAVERDAFAHNVGIGTEAATPKVGAQQGRGTVAGFVFFGQQ